MSLSQYLQMAALSSPFQTSSIQSYYMCTNSHVEKKQLICVVCGSIARGFNFGAITCMSCKVFFRRNAFTCLSNLYCHDEGHCKMTEQTRKHCTYCRLLTCFQVGMKRELFRFKEKNYFNQIETRLASYSYEIVPNNKHMPTTNSDRLQLSNNDWLLLRQISSIFDTFTDHVISKAYEIQHQLSSIGLQPLKMRVKGSYIHDLAKTFSDAALQFIKMIPQFILLPSVNKQVLLIRNTKLVIMFYSHYQLNLKPVKSLTQTSHWISSMECLLFPPTRHLHDEINYLVGHVSFIDPCLIKLILVILTFSTNNIDHDEITIIQKLDEYYHRFVLHQIQNIYVELMWKHMIHRFGVERTIHLFSDIIKTILRIQTVIYAINNGKTSSERKFEENIAKTIDQKLKFDLDNE